MPSCRRTYPWHLIRDRDALVSFDEHSTIPPWTSKFSLRKGYVTTRNKYMRCEKLFYGYEAELNAASCASRGLPGHVRAAHEATARPLIQRVLQCGGRPEHLHALFDAGAAKVGC